MILELLPPLHSMHMFYLLFEAIKCHMKVGDTIVSSKTAKYTGIVDCIGCVNIHNLETHFKCSTSLVSDLYPHLTGWYKPFMPGKPPSPAIMILKVKAFVFHSYLSFSFKKWITLSTRWGLV